MMRRRLTFVNYDGLNEQPLSDSDPRKDYCSSDVQLNHRRVIDIVQSFKIVRGSRYLRFRYK